MNEIQENPFGKRDAHYRKVVFGKSKIEYGNIGETA